MAGLQHWLRHAFGDPGDEPPSERQLELVVWLAREVVRRELTVPALAFLEMSRPLNNLTAQTITFFSPLLSAIVPAERHLEWSAFLERRDAIDRLTAAIEAAGDSRQV
jgi:hypothetical protein